MVSAFGGNARPLRRSRTSAVAPGFRASLPLKMTSSIRSPRRLLALCSPSTHVMASATLLLPQPFGPTMAVTPWSKASSARSGNDLNPLMCRRSKRIGIPRQSLNTTSPSGKGNLTPLYSGLGTQKAGVVTQIPKPKTQSPNWWDSGPGFGVLSRGATLRRRSRQLHERFRFGEQRERVLQLRILPRQVLARDLDAKEIDVDLEADHRADKRLVLFPGGFVDPDPGFLHEVLELRHHCVGD